MALGRRGRLSDTVGLSLPPGVKYSQRGRTRLNPHLDSKARKCIPGRKYGLEQGKDEEGSRFSQVARISRRSEENRAGIWDELEKMRKRKGIYPIQPPARGLRPPIPYPLLSLITASCKTWERVSHLPPHRSCVSILGTGRDVREQTSSILCPPKPVENRFCARLCISTG